jgi:hypothetical protein
MKRRLCCLLAAVGTFCVVCGAEEAALPVIDFNCVGYGAHAGSLPRVRTVLRVAPTGKDDTALLQAAIDEVSRMPVGEDGFRGALLLEGGLFIVSAPLQVRASGVVVRGWGEPVTEVWSIVRNRGASIEIGGGMTPQTGAPVRVIRDATSGATKLVLERVSGFTVGDRIVVQRPSTKEWIAALGMDSAEGNFANQRTHWTAGSRDLIWDRVVVAVDSATNSITLDAPITTALEERFGGGTVARVAGDVPITNVGVERLILWAVHDPECPNTEEHAWTAIALDHVEDAWVSGITAWYYADSAVRVGSRARRVTVAWCTSARPVSEVAGCRRRGYLVQGQQVLVEGCRTVDAVNGFSVGACASGPNVFRVCWTENALGPSGAFEGWASGVLFQRVHVDGNDLRLTRDDATTQGGGITAHNAFVIDCEARSVVVDVPNDATPRIDPRQDPEAVLVTADFGEYPEVPVFRLPPVVPTHANPVPHPLSIVRGRFFADGRVVWGGQLNAGWWKGQASPAIAATAAGRSITRFAPGRTGPGLTEDLPQFARDMVAAGQFFHNGIPGLWYDRRRDDHLLIARTDATVWAPFYEMPWARSGVGRAFDGMSKYDLTKFNPWYFERMREFAELCTQHGLVFTNNLYNTHNLLETLAHWVDYPWRPENNINDTGLPVPQEIDAGNTIHIADQVYDVSRPGRRELHRAFIRHHLDVLGDEPNVVHCVGFQFAGPLEFQQFFLDTVAEWEREHGRDVKIALITSKDITDAVLTDPVRAPLVDVVDMRYWQTLADGTLWAPRGDVNRAFREQNAELFGRGFDTPPDTTPLLVYRAVREYRDRFPDKAIIAWNGGCGQVPVLLAGGAQVLLRNPASGQSQGVTSDATPLDAFVRERMGDVLMHMTPRDGWLADGDNNWCLADETGRNVLFSSLAGPAIVLARDLPAATRTGIWFDVATGATKPAELPPSLATGVVIAKPTAGAWLLLLRAPSG